MTNEKKKRKTVGELSLEASQKTPEAENAVELAKDMLTDYDKEVIIAIEDGIKRYSNRDFYVVVLTKREVALHHVMRNIFFTRLSCPTPSYNQADFKYHYKDERIDYKWVVPDEQTCRTYIMNKAIIDPSEYDMLQNILDFTDGTLYEKCLKLNGER